MIRFETRGLGVLPQVAAALVLALTLGTTASAATVWDEGGDGDLSNIPLAPSAALLAAGSNVVNGTMGGNDARDYLAITVPAGHQLTALLQLLYTNASGGTGDTGFHGLAPGNTSFIPDGVTIASFLGTEHMDTQPPNTTAQLLLKRIIAFSR